MRRGKHNTKNNHKHSKCYLNCADFCSVPLINESWTVPLEVQEPHYYSHYSQRTAIGTMSSSVSTITSTIVSSRYHISDSHLGWKPQNINSRMRRSQDETSKWANASWNEPSKASCPSMNTALLLSKKRKQSNRLRQILKSDLLMGLKTSPAREGQAGGDNEDDEEDDVMKRRLRLDVQEDDIQKLLTSLQSTEFVGTIDPKYHSRYLTPPSIR